MTKLEMEQTVAALLLEQRRFRRLGTNLPPDKLSLLSRLLYRLGYTKMSRSKPIVPIRYMRLSLSTPRPAVSFGGESVNEHDMKDEAGNTVGNIRIRDRGPMLHVDWIGGKGQFAAGNKLGNEAIRSVHDAIANHYPNAQYLRGHRISGFRSKDQATGHAVVIPIRRRKKMERLKPIGGVKRYAKFNAKTKAHPLVAGFPIEHALRHIANSSESTDSAKNLAVAVLKGHTEALWGLHDELQDHNEGKGHSILKAGYKWLNAADKLHLDKHTYTALNEAAERRRGAEPYAETQHENGQYRWQFTPEHQAMRSVSGINSHPGSENGRIYQGIVDRVRELSPHSTDDSIRESIRRHGHRATMQASIRTINQSPDQHGGRAIQHPTVNKRPDATSHINELASRYSKKPKKYSLANKSNFIGALLKSSSPEHKIFVQRTKELARKMGAKQTKEFPALHDTPNQSVPGVAMAVYGHIQPDSAHALGSWVNGLLPNGPGYAVFHARPTGPDTLYRLRMEGSGYDARAKLDRAGISSRVFVPHRKGLDILIPDKGNRIGQQVQQFAKMQKVPIESSTGHLTTAGSQDQGQARSTFRNKVSKVEQMSRSKKSQNTIKLYSQLDNNPGDHTLQHMLVDSLIEDGHDPTGARLAVRNGVLTRIQRTGVHNPPPERFHPILRMSRQGREKFIEDSNIEPSEDVKTILDQHIKNPTDKITHDVLLDKIMDDHNITRNRARALKQKLVKDRIGSKKLKYGMQYRPVGKGHQAWNWVKDNPTTTTQQTDKPPISKKGMGPIQVEDQRRIKVHPQEPEPTSKPFGASMDELYADTRGEEPLQPKVSHPTYDVEGRSNQDLGAHTSVPSKRRVALHKWISGDTPKTPLKSAIYDKTPEAPHTNSIQDLYNDHRGEEERLTTPQYDIELGESTNQRLLDRITGDKVPTPKPKKSRNKSYKTVPVPKGMKAAPPLQVERTRRGKPKVDKNGNFIFYQPNYSRRRIYYRFGRTQCQ